MRHHRTIWYITAFAVLVAAIVLAIREAGERVNDASTRPGTSDSQLPSITEADELIESMFALVDKDPKGRRERTRKAVEEVAALAEQGLLQTAETYFALGLRLHRSQRELEASEAAYRKAIGLKPDWWRPYGELGCLLHAMRRPTEALAAVRTAIKLNPEASKPHSDLAVFLRLGEQQDEAQLREAEDEARTALELDPAGIGPNNNYGNLLVVQGKFDLAEQRYRKAIEIAPDYPEPYYNLACAFSLQGRGKEALPLLAKAAELDEAFREEAKRDEDLDAIRDEPEFQELIYGDAARR